MALNGSLCLAGEGKQSAEVDSRVIGIGKAVGVVKSLEKKEKGLRVDTSETEAQSQAIGDRKRPFEDVVQSEPSVTTCTLDEMRKTTEVNYFGSFLGIKHAAIAMKEHKPNLPRWVCCRLASRSTPLV